MAACAASSVAFRAAVAPRAVAARKTTAVKASRANVVSCNAQVQKISVNDVKDHLDRGFVIVDIRDPEECAASGYKSSWKNIVVRVSRRPRITSKHQPTSSNFFFGCFSPLLHKSSYPVSAAENIRQLASASLNLKKEKREKKNARRPVRAPSLTRRSLPPSLCLLPRVTRSLRLWMKRARFI